MYAREYVYTYIYIFFVRESYLYCKKKKQDTADHIDLDDIYVNGKTLIPAKIRTN